MPLVTHYPLLMDCEKGKAASEKAHFKFALPIFLLVDACTANQSEVRGKVAHVGEAPNVVNLVKQHQSEDSG